MNLRAIAAAALIASGTLAGAMPIRVVSPQHGAVLRGGTLATIAWESNAPLRDAEEWEAFLSFDGGKYYALRITPHLEIGERRVQWFVPNVASRDARILIRYGNERDEHIVELPMRLTIEARPDSAMWPAERRSASEGESARLDGRAVIGWVDSDRAFVFAIATKPPAMIATIRPAPTSDCEEQVAVERAPLPVTELLAKEHRPIANTIALASDVLLISSRLNI
jgi:hypothetical protein